MPKWNDESLRIYKENQQLVIACRKLSDKHWFIRGENPEHLKVYDLCKYATFNDQLTIKQVGWLKAYLRRNGVELPTISSTQLADSSIISAD
jgi:hypothetical protein